MLEILIIIAIGAACVFVEELVRLLFTMIRSWFQNKQELTQSDRNNIAFTLQDKLSNGKYSTVQGIYNKSTNEVIDGRMMHSNELDSNLENIHANNELAIYE